MFNKCSTVAKIATEAMIISRAIGPDAEALKLKGLLGFAKHIEPKFYESLIVKYTVDVISNVERC